MAAAADAILLPPLKLALVILLGLGASLGYQQLSSRMPAMSDSRGKNPNRTHYRLREGFPARAECTIFSISDKSLLNS